MCLEIIFKESSLLRHKQPFWADLGRELPVQQFAYVMFATALPSGVKQLLENLVFYLLAKFIDYKITILLLLRLDKKGFCVRCTAEK